MSDQPSSDPNSGLEELVQRIKAISDPVPKARLSPRGSPLPFESTVNGNAPRYEAYEDVRLSAPLPPLDVPASAAADNSYKPPVAFQFRPSVSQIPHPPSAAAESFSDYPEQIYAPVAGSSKAPTVNNAATSGGNLASNQPFASTAAYGSGSFMGFGSGYTPEALRMPSEPKSPEMPNLSSHAAESNTTPAPAARETAPSDDPNLPKSGLQRAIQAVRAALPLVQKLLPLLDGNFATAINALVAPHISQPDSHHAPPQSVKVDLEPVERALNEVRSGHRELRTQVLEQITTFKRVEDQLERVREATDRNTLEQQELVEDLRSVGNRVSTFAIIGLVLLVVSLGINVFFLVQLQHILR